MLRRLRRFLAVAETNEWVDQRSNTWFWISPTGEPHENYLAEGRPDALLRTGWIYIARHPDGSICIRRRADQTTANAEYTSRRLLRRLVNDSKLSAVNDSPHIVTESWLTKIGLGWIVPRPVTADRAKIMESVEEAIRKRAYELWEIEGRPEGRDREHWEQANAEIMTQAGTPGGPAPAETAPRPGAPTDQATHATDPEAGTEKRAQVESRPVQTPLAPTPSSPNDRPGAVTDGLSHGGGISTAGNTSR